LSRQVEPRRPTWPCLTSASCGRAGPIESSALRPECSLDSFKVAQCPFECEDLDVIVTTIQMSPAESEPRLAFLFHVNQLLEPAMHADDRTLAYRCSVIIAASRNPRRFRENLELRAALGRSDQFPPGLTQVERAEDFLRRGEWPSTCLNYRGYNKLRHHITIAPSWTGALNKSHFNEPWHMYCSKCNFALSGSELPYSVDLGPKPPAGWNPGDPV